MNKVEAQKLHEDAHWQFNSHSKHTIDHTCNACDLDAEYYFYTLKPSHPNWAAVYVAAEKPIPEKWRVSFYDELANPNYERRKELERLVQWFGVRWEE